MTTNFIAALATEEGTEPSRASSPYATFTDAQGNTWTAQGNTWTDAQGNTWTLASCSAGITARPLLVLVDGLAAAHTIAEIRAAASDAKDIVES